MHLYPCRTGARWERSVFTEFHYGDAVPDLRANEKGGNELSGLGRLQAPVDHPGLHQGQDTVGKHLGVNAQVLQKIKRRGARAARSARCFGASLNSWRQGYDSAEALKVITGTRPTKKVRENVGIRRTGVMFSLL